MPQYAILMYAPESDDEAPAAPEERAPYDRHAEKLNRLGVMVAAFALQPAPTARSIYGELITDGPFLETKEQIAGFYVIDAADLDAALEIARQNPILQHGGGLEVRPVESSEVHPVQGRRP